MLERIWIIFLLSLVLSLMWDKFKPSAGELSLLSSNVETLGREVKELKEITATIKEVK